MFGPGPVVRLLVCGLDWGSWCIRCVSLRRGSSGGLAAGAGCGVAVGDGFGLVPAADVGPGPWSQAVVEAADPEAVRAALRGIEAGVAADRLTEALQVPLPILRPRVTAAAVGHLLKALGWEGPVLVLLRQADM